MTAIIAFYTKDTYPVLDIYNYVAKVAKKLFYTGTRGTPFITIRKIFHESLERFKLPKAHVKFAKEIGYNFKDIQTQINKNNPVILSMVDDGRDYYENHSITVMGWEIWRVGDKTVRMLAVADNWSTQVSYVDYEKLSAVSSIHYCGISLWQKLGLCKNSK